MIKFNHSGNSVSVISYDENSITDKLRPAVYQVCYSDFTGFYLEKIKDSFEINEDQVFGQTMKRFQKISRTYHERPSSTGVLLTGTKGSGKTLLAEITCNHMIQEGIPVVTVSEPYRGTAFNKFISDIGDCVILIDEFAKVYERQGNPEDEGGDPQSSLLTLFNGVYSNKRLILLTENDTHSINEFMLGRTSRIYYHWEFNRLDKATILEYCNFHNVPEDIAEQIVQISYKCEDFTFDILKAVIEEQARFGGTIESAVEDLNIELRYSANTSKVKVIEVTKLSDGSQVGFQESTHNIDLVGFGRPSCFYLDVKETGVDRRTIVGSGASTDYPIQVYVPVRDIVYQSDTHVIFENMDHGLLIKAEILEEPSTETMLAV